MSTVNSNSYQYNRHSNVGNFNKSTRLNLEKISCCTKIVLVNGMQLIAINTEYEEIVKDIDTGAPFHLSCVILGGTWSNVVRDGLFDPNHIAATYEINAASMLSKDTINANKYNMLIDYIDGQSAD